MKTFFITLAFAVAVIGCGGSSKGATPKTHLSSENGWVSDAGETDRILPPRIGSKM